jgi:hypothetical protein
MVRKKPASAGFLLAEKAQKHGYQKALRGAVAPLK